MKLATCGLVTGVEAVDVLGALVSALVGNVPVVIGDEVGVVSVPGAGDMVHTGHSVTNHINPFKQIGLSGPNESEELIFEELRAFRGYFSPPMRL